MRENKKSLWSGWVKRLIFISAGLVAFAFISPILITQLSSSIEFNTDTGVIGDTIGGIVNPFIALAGVIVTGLAFYMQLRANQIQIDNFQTELQTQKETFEKQLEIQHKENRLNQFEAQFYEMLRLHKENVNEIEIDLYEFSENRVYNSPSREGRNLLSSRSPIREKNSIRKTVKGRDVFLYFSNELHFAFKVYRIILGNQIQFFNFSIPYTAFFNGIHTLQQSQYQTSLYEHKSNFDNYFVHEENSEKEFLGIPIKSYYLLFEGHENKLGHYYRHLYQTVKFVAVENDFLTYSEKRKYLRILRAQLSNFEQAMLFYNYLAYAPEWERPNKFFSDYRMIHNLYVETLIPDEYFLNQYLELQSLQNTALTYKENDFIFESQKWNFTDIPTENRD